MPRTLLVALPPVVSLLEIMARCIVLGDAVVHNLLINLKREEIITIRDEISQSLCDFSMTDERQYQPEPAVVTRADSRKTLFRPFTSSTGPGIKIIVDPISAVKDSPASSLSANLDGKKQTLHGILTVCDQDGIPTGLINADEVTAYRTAMSVMIPYSWRSNTANIVVFGAGKTALWHIRQALGLRGDEIRCITVINRSAEGARILISQVQKENEHRWRSRAEFRMVSHDHPAYQAELQKEVAQADAIFCTTPSSTPVFPAKYLIGTSSKKSCFVSGIGSWQPEMAELDPDLFMEASATGLVVVDDIAGAMSASGEIIQSGLQSEQIKEVGQLLHMRSQSSANIPIHLEKCLQDGLVVYKSVGVSLTDCAAANALLALAKAQGRGILLSDF